MIDKHQAVAEKKHEHFIKVVSPRVNKALEAIDRIGRCGNRTVYEYSEEEAAQIFNALREAVEDAFDNYNSKGKRKREPFRLQVES